MHTVIRRPFSLSLCLFLSFVAPSRALRIRSPSPLQPSVLIFFPPFVLYVFLFLSLSLSFQYYDPSSMLVYSSLVPTVSSTPLRRLRYFIIGTIRPLSWIIPQADKVAEYRRVSLYGSSVSPFCFSAPLPLFLSLSLSLSLSRSTARLHGFFFFLPFFFSFFRSTVPRCVFRVRDSSCLVIVSRSIIIFRRWSKVEKSESAGLFSRKVVQARSCIRVAISYSRRVGLLTFQLAGNRDGSLMGKIKLFCCIGTGNSALLIARGYGGESSDSLTLNYSRILAVSASNFKSFFLFGLNKHCHLVTMI